MFHSCLLLFKMRERERTIHHDASWTVTDYFIYQPWLNVLLSSLGYLMFGLMVYACKQKGVLRKRMHDIFLLLSYALIVDIFETAQHVYFINKFGEFDFINTGEDDKMRLTTTTSTTTCTLVVSLFYAHFLIVYVEAGITIRRFIGEKVVRATVLYVMLGVIFAVEILILIASILFPSRTSEWFRYAPISCNRSYSVGPFSTISFFVTLFTMGITPIFSTILIIKQLVRKQPDSDVTAVFLLSSYSMSALLISLLVVFANAFIRNFLEWATIVGHFIFLALLFIQDFRFPFLCLLSVMIVSEIRGAVSSCIADVFRRLGGDMQPKGGALLNTAEIEEKENDIRLDNVFLKYDRA
ncbi:hypothetical protein PRIPAC_85515 [Pristionchus pacificus]|uniref:Uncharacterized protein n=1 Tax=Pristionchus pacificus TaxID=54126 RepID=A0A2A6BTG9_PRIPA|nr:hypothetical protein PRIPAC_85515 [Pristionchus pacificus]|eukprot:PDM69185.1 hypothetical protein PRIPAC_47487 [Pristionchus pacificus]